METDAKGQLGGLDVSAREREKIAGGTSGWRCGACGKSNGEILRECEEAVREKEKEGGKVEEVVVPSELKMGWKDEMGQKGKSNENEDGESAELAEGFVRTTDGAGDTPLVEAQPPAPTPAQRVEEAREQVRVATDRAVQHVQQHAQLAQRPAQAQARSNDGVPMWIDRAIAGVVILLAAMFMKIILGL